MRRKTRRLRWDALVPFILDFRKVQIVEALDYVARPLSSTDLYHVLEAGDATITLQAANYHVVSLANAGVLTVVDAEQAGDAHQRFYAFASELLG